MALENGELYAINATPGLGTATFTGLAPSLALSVNGAPGLGAATFNGLAPSLALSVAAGHLDDAPQAADDDQAALRGRLPAQHGAGVDTLELFAERTAKALESLGHVISTARAESAKDPVLLEHQAQTGTGEGAAA